VTSREAKEILLLYRPGTSDAEDPSFADAQALCERDPELQRWFQDHCAVYTALRSKFKEAGAPAGLKEQIIAERKIHVSGWRSRPALLSAAAAVVLLGLVYLWLQPVEPAGLPAFRHDAVSTALRAYQMQLETKNLEEIRGFFAGANAIADYVLPEALQQNAQAAGCVAFTWRSQPVSMICFQSGQPRRPDHANDVWLFVVDQSATPGAPGAAKPEITTINYVTTASWSAEGKTYLLAVIGDEAFLRRFL
jgi:hypothetical protein